MRPVAAILAAAVAAVLVSACGGSAAPRFSTTIDNPWLPLRPGTTLTYEGVKDGEPLRDVVRVTRRTRVVGGVRCVVVDDRAYSRGRLSERTSDYYAQDRRGDVWYFGEDTAELDSRGRVTSAEGSWHTGVGGARPGLFMPAHPRVGERHLQEYYRGHAEDQFGVVSLHSRVSVPYGTFRDALETREWTRLEPRVLDAKYYVRGIGEVFEGSLRGPAEYAKLVAVSRR